MLLPIEDVDLVVAMCAVSTASDQSFKLMKDTVKSIVDKYGTSKIHYSVVLYGSQVVPMLKFSDKTLTKKGFKEYIDVLPKPKGNVCEKLYIKPAPYKPIFRRRTEDFLSKSGQAVSLVSGFHSLSTSKSQCSIRYYIQWSI